MTELGPPAPAAGPPAAPPLLRRVERSLLALLAGVVALPLLLIGGVAWHGHGQAWQEAELELTRAAEVAAEYLRRVLDGHDLRLQRAGDLLAGLDDTEIRAREPALHQAFIRIAGQEGDGSGPITLFAFDGTAHLLVGATVLPVPRDIDFADRDFIQALRDPTAPEPFVSRVHVGRLDGRPFFSVARRRDAEGTTPPEPTGVVVVSVYADAANAALRRVLRSPEDVLTLVRLDGAVLARSAGFGLGGEPADAGGEALRLATMARSEAGGVVLARSTIDGVRRLAVFRRVEGWPLHAAAARPDAAILQRWRRNLGDALAVGLPAWGLLLGMAGAVWRRQRALGEANATLEGRVAARTQALAESEARLRLAQEVAGIGTWESNAATGEIRWSPEQYRLFGLDPAQAPPMTRERFLALVHSEDRARAAAASETALRSGTYELEFRILRPQPEGEPQLRWLLGRGRRLDVPVDRLLGVNVDITDRHAAEERRELVAQEVSHRAKNALQLVGAAVRLTRATDTAEFIRLVEGRVAALARAQVLLAETGGRGADLQALAEGEVATVLAAEGDGPSMRYRGPRVALAEEAVQPLSMALHELATNAVKYGALSVPEGQVELGWEVDRTAGLLRLRWAERHGPRPDPAPAREGFGARVLEATLAARLGGRLRRDWQPEGLVLEVDLPLDRVLAG